MASTPVHGVSPRICRKMSAQNSSCTARTKAQPTRTIRHSNTSASTKPIALPSATPSRAKHTV